LNEKQTDGTLSFRKRKKKTNGLLPILALLLPEKPASKVGNTALLPTLNFLSTTIVKKKVALPSFFSSLYLLSTSRRFLFFKI
jgi:hypothetical protein